MSRGFCVENPWLRGCRVDFVPLLQSITTNVIVMAHNTNDIEGDIPEHPTILSQIAFEGTKIKWHGSFEELKLFAESYLGLKGKWTSPGGSTKLFNSDEIMIKYSKQSSILSFEGEACEKIKEAIVKLVENRPEHAANSTFGDQESNKSTFESDILKLHRRIDNIEVDLRGEISKIVAQLIAISNEQNHLEYTKDYASLLLKQNEDLTKYNFKLKQENDELRDRLNTMALALSDLNRKVEDTENEKLSLVTVLKILHEEQANDFKDHSRADGWQNKTRSNTTSNESTQGTSIDQLLTNNEEFQTAKKTTNKSGVTTAPTNAISTNLNQFAVLPVHEIS